MGWGRVAYAECQHCLFTDDRMTMVECGQCHATRHVHCLRRPLQDAELFQDDVRVQSRTRRIASAPH